MSNGDHVQREEQPWAGVINGFMITLLGSAFPALLVWKMAADIVDRGFAATVRAVDWTDANAMLMVFWSAWAARKGFRILRENILLLRAR